MSPRWRKTRLVLSGPVEALAQAMSRLPRGSRCEVIVSSRFARYVLVPFSTAVVGRAATEALAAHVFRATHGQRVDGWRVRVAPGRGLRVACALDAELLDSILAAATEHGIRLTGIEPAFAAGFNAAARRLPASCWFAVIEPERLVLGLLIDRQWRHLATARCGADPEGALTRLVQREALLADAPAAGLPCHVHTLQAAA